MQLDERFQVARAKPRLAEPFRVEADFAHHLRERPAILDSPLLVARAFELKPGEIEEDPFPVSTGQVFIGQPEIQASKLPELAEVKDKVKEALVSERTRERARALAADLRARSQAAGLDKAATVRGGAALVHYHAGHDATGHHETHHDIDRRRTETS